MAYTPSHPRPGENYSQFAEGSVESWLTTVDHKRIGIMYLWSILFFFFIGGIFALLVRIGAADSEDRPS